MEALLNEIKSILESPYSTENFISLVKEIFPDMQLVAPDRLNKEFSNFSNYVDGYVHIGNYKTHDNKKILILAIQLKNAQYVENSRSAQRNYAKKLIENNNCDAAFIAFYTKINDNHEINDSNNKWRISFVKIDYSVSFDNGKMSANKNLTPAKRYSYLVGKGEPSHTAIERIKELIDSGKNPSLEDIEKAFSVEKVTDEFFKEYTEKFNDLNDYLKTNEEFIDEAKRLEVDPDEFSVQFSKKLLGQIVFLYFLQKKGWLGVNAWPIEITEKEFKHAFYDFDKKLTKKFIPKLYVRKSEDSDKFIINTKEFNDPEMSDDDEAYLSTTVKSSVWGSGPRDFMRKYFEVASNQPNKNFFDDYLEPLFYDALNNNRGEKGYWTYFHCRIPFLSGSLFEPINNYDWKHSEFNIPNEMFSNKKSKDDPNGTGILDIFDRYNFTMSEDEPMEKEVAIDPEMLGKVFESMLEVKDRKAKGEFYTPREIVHYMCQESLINYLTNKTGISYNAIRDFILYGEYIKSEDTNKNNKTNLLISEEIYKEDENGNIIVNRLIEIDNLLANIKVADPAVGSGAFPLGMLNEIVKTRETITDYLYKYKSGNDKRLIYLLDRSVHRLKMETIKNSIFAVDLEPSAVEITKLRLWLSLVIDDEINPNAQSELDGHKNPLPLPNLECNILCGNSLIDEFKGIRLIEPQSILGMNTNGETVSFFENTIKMLIDKLLDEQDKLFLCTDTGEKIKIKNNIEAIKLELIKTQLASGGADSNIIDDLKKANNKASKPFILWQLDFARVFRDNKGFDIVIGNPPYVGESGHKEIFQEVAKTDFGKKYYIGKMDFWYFFVSKGLNLLKKNGILSYIAPNNWMTTSGGKNVRNDILDRAKILHFIDFRTFMVFDTAAQQTMIFVLEKEKCDKYKFEYKYLDSFNKEESKDRIINLLLSNKIGVSYKADILKADNYNKILNFNNIENNKILFKIKEHGNFYLDAKNEIAQGIVFPQDTLNKKSAEKLGENFKVGQGVFVLTQDELNFLKLDNKEKQVIKPYFTTEQIKKWKTNKNNNYWLIYSNKEIANTINNYPRIKAHLDIYRDIITSDNKPYGLHRARNEKFFKGEKIISVRKCLLPTFSYSAFDVYVSQTFNIIKTNRINYKYLLGILNSSTISFWLRYKGKMQGDHFQIDAEPLKEIPICYSKEYENELINNVEKLLISDENDINALEKNINELVYKIYNIDEEEIKIIEDTYYTN